MNRPELYKKTIDILYKAYFDDTLEHNTCSACAVGNIVAANCGYTIDKKIGGWRNAMGKLICPDWDYVFSTAFNKQRIEPKNYRDEAKAEIDATGYEWQELAKIEFAFESANRGSSMEDYNFNGLCSVLDALAQIHEVTDTDLITTTSKRFSDHYKSRSLCATNATSLKPL